MPPTSPTSTVAAPGSLLVTKTIAGPLAGQQGPITIHVVCNGTALSPDFVIGAGSAAGSVSHSFDGIPAGSVCTVTETADGGTTTVLAIVVGQRADRHRVRGEGGIGEPGRHYTGSHSARWKTSPRRSAGKVRSSRFVATSK